MECNREDAIKAQQMAEHKIVMEDYSAAKKLALKAQRLFPSLSGLPQMLAVVDVHCIASEDLDCLPSKWHQILQTEQNAGEEAVRKQYRRLLLLLHPDKNKFAGAASAFKLVKAAYEAFEKEKLDKPAAQVGDNQPVSKPGCFWTVCPKCRTSAEHMEISEHQYVQCLGCLCPFIAVRNPQTKESCQSKSQHESADSFQKQTKPDSQHDEVKAEKEKMDSDESRQKGKVLSSSSEDFGNKRKRRSRLKTTKMRSRAPRGATQATSVGTSRREGRQKVSVSASDTDLSNGSSFKACPNDFVHPVKAGNLYTDLGADVGDCSHRHHMRKNDLGDIGDSSHQCTYETAKNDSVNIGDCNHEPMHSILKDDLMKRQDSKGRLFEKLRSAIMNECNGLEFQAVEVRQDDTCAADTDIKGGVNDKVLQLKLTVTFLQNTMNSHAQAAASENCMVGGSEIWEEDQESVQCQVPDNDVHNFDKERQAEMFAIGQIWAVYDDDDGLPRFYAHIAEVISVRPFRVRMNWLFPAKTVSEDVQAWVKAGFAYTCGEFIYGKALNRKSLKMFSHIMAHEAGPQPRSVRIYPQKGDVWALYKVWKPRKGVTRTCEPVEVISHYSEELGVEVAGLFKVAGYISIYCRKGMEGVRFIPTAELTRFSHQIPAHFLLGNEVSGLPEDCVDLDMAAITEDKGKL